MTLNHTDLFPNSFDTNFEIVEGKFSNLLRTEINYDVDYSQKHEIISSNESVNPLNIIAFPPDFGDLARLHYLCRSRKVTTVLEFGVGKSSCILASALRSNSYDYHSISSSTLRRANLYELHSVDNNQNWINIAKENIDQSLSRYCNFHYSKLQIGSFMDRLCTYYQNLPNISPDLIYLDGPDQFSATGDLRGLSTAYQDSMPMAADILVIEHFLQPGSLIVIDGRAANARFLRCNLQRDWEYLYIDQFDQHFFELQEPPLGRYNKMMIEHCLGDSFIRRLSNR